MTIDSGARKKKGDSLQGIALLHAASARYFRNIIFFVLTNWPAVIL
jgi:hypothetical protein